MRCRRHASTLTFVSGCLAFLFTHLCLVLAANSGSSVVARTLVAKIFRLSDSNADSELIYDSRQRETGDINLTLSLEQKQNQNTTTMTSPEYGKFRYYFECSSSGSAPSRQVEWVYEGQGMPHVHIVNERMLDSGLKKSTEFSKPMGVRYISTIWFYSGGDREETATGLYTCRFIAQPSVNTTFYAFFSGKYEFMLDALLSSRRLRSDEKFTVVHAEPEAKPELFSTKSCRIININVKLPVTDFTDSDYASGLVDGLVTLPCSVTKPYFQLRPKTPVLLYKVNSSSGGWSFLPVNASNRNLQYDPRIGFRIHSSLLAPRNLANSYFVCASNNVKTLINITVAAAAPLQNASIPNQPLKIEYNRITHEFTCVGRLGAAFGIVPCHSATHCQFVKAGLRNYLHARSQSMASTGLSELGHDQDKDLLEANARPIQPSLKPIEYEFMDSGLVYCWNPSQPRQNSYSNFAALPLSFDFDAVTFYKLQNGSFWVEGQISPSAADAEILQVGILPAVDDEDDETRKSKSNGSYGSDSITFYCEGSRLFLAEPFVWTWRLVGGNSSSFEQGKLNSERKTIRSLLKFTRSEVGEYKNIESIECHAPIWNSGAWTHAAVSMSAWKKAITTAATLQNSATISIRGMFKVEISILVLIFSKLM